MRTTKATDRAKAMAIACEWERQAKETDELQFETPTRKVAPDLGERVGDEGMVSENPKIKVDPPTWYDADRDESKVIVEYDAQASQGGEVKTSVLAILCMLSALMGFLFFPALAALPLGILALRRIDESDGALGGRHLAIAGLCICVMVLAVWLVLIAAGWIALGVLDGFVGNIFHRPPAQLGGDCC